MIKMEFEKEYIRIQRINVNMLDKLIGIKKKKGGWK
ncbi:hypothetical protein BSUW23_06105 [Bacillus spizizenii str. W23]|uniref:Uncharacterized protein n=1 Tax=Bacillus spizizenii (strain ATCC 23059 / NRRL B-14472 / W23) TaxID=655816 RepID=E0U0C8_BACSH|nr:hypothetical protein BSUW23_06105 [Bacillus spizizenii str. W23]EFG91432.1 hypothetical protein BSU6633_16052 [Bacillus spizizenii ATCC 6633 = JCM 2499]